MWAHDSEGCMLTWRQLLSDNVNRSVITRKSSMMNTRRIWTRLTALCLALAAGQMCTTTLTYGAENRPNILFIMSDDHAYQAMSCYGSNRNTTPNLDRLATEGMRFDRCFVTNSICGPSRAVILTGKYGHLNGYVRNGQTFNGAQQNVAKLLS